MIRAVCRRLTAVFLVLLLVFSVAGADGGLTPDQTVPFGVTTSKGGQLIPVFDTIASKNKTDLLLPGELCVLDSSVLESSYYWYHIVYLNDDGEAQAGYVKESNFEQLMLSDYTEMLRNPETAERVSQYFELMKTSSLFIGEENSRMAGKEGSSKGQHYVLNTNTMKFHYPDCKSVGQMKEKNRKDFTGSREELIEVGYVPCKNCNP